MKNDISLRKMFEAFIEDNKDVMYEGLNIDVLSKTVSLTDEHNKGVDFTLENNPIYYKLGNIDVISIFKRTPLKSVGHEVDGNPFIYALKGENGWRFEISQADATKYMKRFLAVCNKIKSKYDTIISVPSASWVNKRFMDVIASKVNAKYKRSDYFEKATLEEAWNSIDGEGIRKYAALVNKINPTIEATRILNIIGHGFEMMEKKNKTFFTSKMMDKSVLKFIKSPISSNTSNTAECAELFDDKNVLILDDILASGNTLSFCAQNILETYSPKSVTAVTLLSKKF